MAAVVVPALDRPLTFGSLFAGIGGFDLGFEAAGMTVAWQVENDPYCQQVLADRWPDTPKYLDVKDVGRRELGRPDIICGGFPCQDLSVAGRRAGLAGKRSGLWWEFARVVREVRPRWVVIENVPGLLSSNRGRDMGAILGTLGDLGYGFAYRVLDAQFFGLAQRRKRVFIVGRLGDPAGGAEVLLVEEGGVGDPPARPEAGEAVAALTANGLGGGGADDNLAQAGHLIPASVAIRGRDGDAQAEVGEPGLANTLRASDEGSSRPWILTPTHDVSPSLTARQGKGADQLASGSGKPGQGYPAVRVCLSVRRLTPLECERLQGFPDGHTGVLSDTRRYRALGNAVAVPVAAWLGRRIVAYEARKVLSRAS